MSSLLTPGLTTYSGYNVFSLYDTDVTVDVSGQPLVVSQLDVRLDKVHRQVGDQRLITAVNWSVTLCTKDYNYIQDWIEYQQRLFSTEWNYSTLYKRQLSIQVGDQVLQAEGIWVKDASFSDGYKPGEIDCLVNLHADHVHWTNAKPGISWDITLPK